LKADNEEKKEKDYLNAQKSFWSLQSPLFKNSEFKNEANMLGVCLVINLFPIKDSMDYFIVTKETTPFGVFTSMRHQYKESEVAMDTSIEMFIGSIQDFKLPSM
jgi:hypothetical protein